MLLSHADRSRVIAGLRLLQELGEGRVEITDRLVFDAFEHDVLTNGGALPKPTSEEIDNLVERLQHDSRLCPYCGRLMAFEGYESDYLTDRDSSAVWLCENPSCRAGLAEVRFPPNPDEYEGAKP